MLKNVFFAILVAQKEVKTMGKRVYLGLGSNLGNKERIVRKTIDKIGERGGSGRCRVVVL